MPLIQVWECPKTKKIFKTKEKYKAHLKTLAMARYQKRTLNAHIASYRTFIRETLATASSFREIEEWFLTPENWKAITNHLNRTRRGEYEKKIDGLTIERFEFSNMHWNDFCSNSHVAPEGKMVNWRDRLDHHPKGYPGWHGRLLFKVIDYCGSEIFRNTPIHTGSGGGSSYTGVSGYDVTLFAEEWNSLAVMEKIKNSR